MRNANLISSLSPASALLPFNVDCTLDSQRKYSWNAKQEQKKYSWSSQEIQLGNANLISALSSARCSATALLLLKIDCTHCTRFGPTQEILRENKKAIKARLNCFGICTFTTGACHIQIRKTCTATVHMYRTFISNGTTSCVKRDGEHNALYRKDFEGNPCFILAFIRPLLQVLHSWFGVMIFASVMKSV